MLREKQIFDSVEVFLEHFFTIIRDSLIKVFQMKTPYYNFLSAVFQLSFQHTVL
jgi:hypothetical protein